MWEKYMAIKLALILILNQSCVYTVSINPTAQEIITSFPFKILFCFGLHHYITFLLPTVLYVRRRT